jgi:hypothetical protein
MAIRKRPRRTSWTKQHVVVVATSSSQLRRCKHCGIAWSSNTSTGTIAKHLSSKHGIVTGSKPEPAAEEDADSANKREIESSVVTDYIIGVMLPPAHVSSPAFGRFLRQIAPGYEPPQSASAVERSILQAYTVLRRRVAAHLSSMQGARFAVAVGCGASRTFRPVSLHWVHADSGEPVSMLLDLLFQPTELSQALFARLRSFGISSRLLALTSSVNAPDNTEASEELARSLRDLHGFDVLRPSHVLRCMAHTFQLGVASAAELISPTSVKLAEMLGSASTRHFGSTRDMDDNGASGWASSFPMFQKALELGDRLSLAPEDWNRIQAMEQWLRLPFGAYSYLSSSSREPKKPKKQKKQMQKQKKKHATISLYTLALACLEAQCERYKAIDARSLGSGLANEALRLQHEASDRCLQHLRGSSTQSAPSRIAMFLDPRWTPVFLVWNRRNLRNLLRLLLLLRNLLLQLNLCRFFWIDCRSTLARSRGARRSRSFGARSRPTIAPLMLTTTTTTTTWPALWAMRRRSANMRVSSGECWARSTRSRFATVRLRIHHHRLLLAPPPSLQKSSGSCSFLEHRAMPTHSNGGLTTGWPWHLASELNPKP